MKMHTFEQIIQIVSKQGIKGHDIIVDLV